VLQHGDEHGRHAVEAGDALLVDAGERRLGGEIRQRQSVAPWVMEAVMASTMPKQWNIGTWIIMRSAVERSMRSPMHLPLLTTL
jgi:hypothetical protein